MIPRGPDGIRHSARYLRDSLIPAIDDPFIADDLRLIAQHFDIVAEDFDRAVDNMVCDRSELERFFSAAISHLDGVEADATAAALADTTASLRTRDLMARADRDMATFIAVHARLDRAFASGEEWSAPLREEAWRFLDGYLERRRYRSVG